MKTTSAETIIEIRYFGERFFCAITKKTNAAAIVATVNENMLYTKEYCPGVRVGSSGSISRPPIVG
jgi:hypothetical protein